MFRWKKNKMNEKYKLEIGLRTIVYLALLLLIICSFSFVKETAIKFASAPAWIELVSLDNILIIFFIMGIIFEVWLANFKRISVLFCRYEYHIWMLCILALLVINIISQFTMPSAGDHRFPLRIGYLISQGFTPYEDFFDHHHLLYSYLIAAVFTIFPNLTGIITNHLLIFIALCVSCFFLYKISLEFLKEKRLAYMTVLFFLSFKNIIVSYNIRYDVFAVLFLIISIFFLVKARKGKYYFLSGFLLGIGFLVLQKILPYFMGICAILLFIEGRWKLKIKNIIAYLSGFFIPLIIFYTFWFLLTGISGLKKYYLLTFLWNYNIDWGFSILNKLLAYAVFNGLHIILIAAGTVLLLKYRKNINKFRLLFGIVLLNWAVCLFFTFKSWKISPQDFLYFIPFLSIPGIICLNACVNAIRPVLRKYGYGFGIFALLVVPMAFTSMNFVALSSDYGTIQFYLDNFSGTPTNCNFIFNPLHQYHWTSYSWWTKEENSAVDFFQQHGMDTAIYDLDEMIAAGFNVICVESYLGPSAESRLVSLGYTKYQHSGPEIIYFKR